MMRAATRAGTGATVAAAAAYPLLIHAAVVSEDWQAVAVALVLVQAIVTVVALARSTWRWRWLAGLGVAGVQCLSWYSVRDGLLATSGLRHAALYAGLFALFAGSLWPGREALVTVIARQIRGQLTDDMVAYTRTVTAAWCCFFTGQVAVSLILFLAAPHEVWSLFVNVLDLPLVALMFGAEHAVRLRRFPGQPHGSLVNAIRAFNQQTRTGQAGPTPRETC